MGLIVGIRAAGNPGQDDRKSRREPSRQSGTKKSILPYFLEAGGGIKNGPGMSY